MPSPIATTTAHAESEAEKLVKMSRVRNKELNENLVPDPSVSDEVACGVFLRFIGEGYRNSPEREVKKKYAASIGFNNPNDQENLLQHAEKYVSISNQIAANSNQYKQGNRNEAALRNLGKDKSKLVKDIVRDLKHTLSADGWNAFNDTVLNRIKPRVKVSRKNQGK